ncbi:MAG: protein kinase [Polyangiaceae bacterium]
MSQVESSGRPALAPGQVVAGRFRLDSMLGRGGMGSVWRAWHETLHIPVAVKFIEPSLMEETGLLQRFATEASAAAKIRSPHVVQVLDHGVDDLGRPYIAMELLEGESLQAHLDRRGTMPIAEVVKLVSDVAKALSKAHAANVVHRDIKPENIFLCPDDEGFVAKVLDFGIAKSETPVGLVQEKTRTGTLLGTPLFMSPEQALGRGGIDSRTDLYSLAVVAYRALTGEVPFVRQGLGELIVAIVNEPFALVSSRVSGISLGVDQWFLKALAKKPEDRFQTAKEMSSGLKLATNSTLTGGHYAIDPTNSPIKISLPDAHGNLRTLPSTDNIETLAREPGREPGPLAEPTVKSADHDAFAPTSAPISGSAPGAAVRVSRPSMPDASARSIAVDEQVQAVTNPGLSLPSDPKQIAAKPAKSSIQKAVPIVLAMLGAGLLGAGIVFTQMSLSRGGEPLPASSPATVSSTSKPTAVEVASRELPDVAASASVSVPASAGGSPSASSAPSASPSTARPVTTSKPAPRPTSHVTPIY